MSHCADVEPGGACPVSCRFPYTGWSSVAVCHPDNTNPDVGLLVVEPECTLTCEDPPNEPQGYIKVSSGNGWACAPGYGGTATWECVIDSVCASKKVLSGCSLLARCILPEDEDACMYDFTECIGETAAPGSSCKVHCKRPYKGTQPLPAAQLETQIPFVSSIGSLLTAKSIAARWQMSQWDTCLTLTGVSSVAGVVLTAMLAFLW